MEFTIILLLYVSNVQSLLLCSVFNGCNLCGILSFDFEFCLFQSNEKLVNRVQHVKKVMKRYKRERR